MPCPLHLIRAGSPDRDDAPGIRQAGPGGRDAAPDASVAAPDARTSDPLPIGGIYVTWRSAWISGEGAPPRRSPCILAIENQNWHDLHLCAVTESGERVRLATLGSLEARRIPIPPTLMLGQRIRLMAVPPLSRETLMTEFVMPDDGRTFHWTLRNHLALSTLVVR